MKLLAMFFSFFFISPHIAWATESDLKATPVGLITQIVDMRSKLPADLFQKMTFDLKTAKRARYSHERTDGVEFEVISWPVKYKNSKTNEEEVGFAAYAIGLTKNPKGYKVTIADRDENPLGIEFKITIEKKQDKSIIGWTSNVSVLAFRPNDINLFNE